MPKNVNFEFETKFVSIQGKKSQVVASSFMSYGKKQRIRQGKCTISYLPISQTLNEKTEFL